MTSSRPEGRGSRPSLQLALLSGRSDPRDARPSAVQRRFLAAAAPPDAVVAASNFPWPADPRPATGGDAEPMIVPLWLASLRNGAQYLLSRRARWAARHRPHLAALLARADHTVLLCGSCGLELLANLDPDGGMLERASVFAVGPVARRRPHCRRLCLVQGRGDRISRWWFAAPDHLVDGGHRDYLENPEVLGLFRAFVAQAADACA